MLSWGLLLRYCFKRGRTGHVKVDKSSFLIVRLSAQVPGSAVLRGQKVLSAP